MRVIELSDICKYYGAGETQVRALDGVTLSVEEGEFLAIVGRSGSGKSTLMNVLGCLDVPTEGEYRLNGQSVFSLSQRALSAIRNRYIGFIFQRFFLLPTLTALENVELPLVYAGVGIQKRRALATEMLQRVGLADRLSHYPAQMSGGQQQRVAIARAAVGRPAVLLADEPTGNLDRAAGEQVMALLLGWHRAGNTVILITHDEQIGAACPRCLRMQDGRLLGADG